MKARALAALAVGFLSSSFARAEGSAADRALAEVLFREGRELMDQGKTETACPKFQESYRLDAALGTLLNLAVCHEKAGQLASAWARYNEAIALARKKNDPERLAYSEEGSRQLDGRFATLRITLPKALEEIAGLGLSLDGRRLGLASLDTPIPVDPGPHRLVVEAAGYETWTHTFDVSPGVQVVPLSVPVLRRAEPSEPARDESGAASANASVRSDSGSTQRGWALGLGVAGVVGVGVAAGAGIYALNQKSERDELCSGAHCPSQEGIDAHRAADSAATVANVAAVAGGALLAAGAVLYFTAPESPSQSAAARHAVSISWDRIVFRGTWD